MAATASRIRDQLEAEQTERGTRFLEVWRVKGLDAASTPAKMDQALAVSPIPSLGAAHPVVAASVVVRKSASAVGPDMADVVVEYANPETEDSHPGLDSGGVYRFSSGVSGDTVREDRNGTIMSVAWSGNMQDLFPDASSLSVSHADVYEAEVFRPQFSMEVSRRLTGANRVTDPRTDALNNVGKVNAATWGAFAARTLLCTGVELEEVTPTETRARVTFEFRRETWDVKHVSRVFGVIPKNVSPGNGLGTFELYEQADFNSSFLIGLTPP